MFAKHLGQKVGLAERIVTRKSKTKQERPRIVGAELGVSSIWRLPEEMRTSTPTISAYNLSRLLVNGRSQRTILAPSCPSEIRFQHNRRTIDLIRDKDVVKKRCAIIKCLICLQRPVATRSTVLYLYDGRHVEACRLLSFIDVVINAIECRKQIPKYNVPNLSP